MLLYSRLSSAQESLLKSLLEPHQNIQVYDLYEVAVVIHTLYKLDLDYQLLRSRFIDAV